MIFTLQQILKVDHKYCSLSGAYRVYTLGGEINYIGISKNVFRRWKEHVKSSEKPNVTGFHKSLSEADPSSLKFEVLCRCSDLDLLKLLEIGYIEIYNSFYNGQNGTLGGCLNVPTKNIATKGGLACLKANKGVHSLSKEQKMQNSKKAGARAFELRKGIHSMTSQKKSELGYKGGKTSQYIWKIISPNGSFESVENEGLENLCNKVGFSYKMAIRIFYRDKGFSEKHGVKIIRTKVDKTR